MIKLLIYIKHNIKFVWQFIEFWNGWLFYLLYKKSIISNLNIILNETDFKSYTFKKLDSSDSEVIYSFIKSQPPGDLEYFKPHGFDQKSIENLFHNKGLLLMGVYSGSIMVGYFFLRFFLNRKCFVGRLVDCRYRGKGIGLIMNSVMYNLAWRMGFRCLSTISRNNLLVMDAHRKNALIHIMKELPNNYLLVEFKTNS